MSSRTIPPGVYVLVPVAGISLTALLGASFVLTFAAVPALLVGVAVLIYWNVKLYVDTVRTGNAKALPWMLVANLLPLGMMCWASTTVFGVIVHRMSGFSGELAEQGLVVDVGHLVFYVFAMLFLFLSAFAGYALARRVQEVSAGLLTVFGRARDDALVRYEGSGREVYRTPREDRSHLHERKNTVVLLLGTLAATAVAGVLLTDHLRWAANAHPAVAGLLPFV